MTPAELLAGWAAMTDEQSSAVLGALDLAMWDEWDCGLTDGLELGFGHPELRIAARTAAILARAWEAEDPALAASEGVELAAEEAAALTAGVAALAGHAHGNFPTPEIWHRAITKLALPNDNESEEA